MAKSAATQSQSFTGPAKTVLVPFQPFIRPFGGGDDEITLGHYMFTHEPFAFDPWKMMWEGRIESLVAAVFANKNHGKTGLAKGMAIRFGGIGAGTEKLRIFGDDHRRNNNVPEWQKVAEFFDSKEIGDRHRINLFDPNLGLSDSGYFQIAIAAFRHGNEHKSPVGNQAFLLQVGINRMFKEFKKYASLEVLILIMSKLTIKHVKAYYAELAMEALETFGETHFDEEIQALIDAPLNIAKQAVRKDASLVAQRYVRLMKGDFGDHFGGTYSMADDLSQRAVFVDYSNMNEPTIALMQTFFWQIKKTARLNGDKRFIYHFEPHDENWKLWNYIDYAVPMSEEMKQSRGSGKFILISSHRLRDYASVGTKGSKQRNLAMNMTDDVSIFFIGKQSKSSLKDLQKKLGFSKADRKICETLKPGQWAVKIGTEDLVFIEVTMTPMEEPLVFSNSALEGMLARQHEGESDELA